MKNRKLTAILLTALLTLPLLAGCDDTPIEVTVDPEIAERYAETVGEYITCVAEEINGDAVTAMVCEAYREQLGKTVKVSMENLGDLNIAAGDEIRVKVDRVEATQTPVVHAETVQIIALGENHPSAGKVSYITPSGIEYGPYSILALSEYRISDEFPAADEMKTRSVAMTERASISMMVRVVDIQDGIVYLSHGNSSIAYSALVGVPELSFSLGDFLLLSASKYGCLTDVSYITMIYSEDVTEMRILSDQEIAKEFYYMYSLTVEKPVIYLYPESPTTCSVKVNLDGTLTCTYPDHGTEGWQNFTAMPDGTLIFPDGAEYYCLYWEGMAQLDPDFSRGFCVKGSDTAAFLAKILPVIGLTPREANEFIIYWLPLLQENPYNLIAFQDEAYTSVAGLEINPAPDSLLRIYMTAKPLDAPVEIEPQTFDGFERNGFTVVEWGGSIIEE
ncbi:MAG: hypothetical protein IJX47_07830 [Clostridia bacterium]|nr:hypothetical protein [Clostridia bacterium]